jgi:hypothetical protein
VAWERQQPWYGEAKEVAPRASWSAAERRQPEARPAADSDVAPTAAWSEPEMQREQAPSQREPERPPQREDAEPLAWEPALGAELILHAESLAEPTRDVAEPRAQEQEAPP